MSESHNMKQRLKTCILCNTPFTLAERAVTLPCPLHWMGVYLGYNLGKCVDTLYFNSFHNSGNDLSCISKDICKNDWPFPLHIIQWCSIFKSYWRYNVFQHWIKEAGFKLLSCVYETIPTLFSQDCDLYTQPYFMQIVSFHHPVHY